MRYLITGGAGFIGSHLAQELVKKGEDVTILDSMFAGRKSNIKSFRDKVEFIEGDIRNEEDVNKAVKDVDYILHQAARRSVPHSLNNANEYNSVNINGTVNLLEAAKDSDVKRIVFASSSSVYGDDAELPLTEGDEGYQISPYALTKFVGERYLRLYYDLYGLETVSLRYFNVFGPRQDPESKYAAVVPIFMRRLHNDKSPIIFGDGEQTRDFTYVKNIVEGNLKACKAKGAAGEAINLANGDQISVNRLARELAELMGKEIEPEYDDPRPGDVKHTMANPTKAQEILGYEGEISFSEGLKKTVEWFLEQAE